MNFITNLIKKPTVAVAQETPKITTTVTPGDWFTSKEHYLEFRAAFKAYVNDDTKKYSLQPVHFIIYAILRNRDWRDGWTIPEHYGKKLENNAKLRDAWDMIKAKWSEDRVLKPFDGTITTEMLMALRENLDEYRDLKK